VLVYKPYMSLPISLRTQNKSFPQKIPATKKHDTYTFDLLEAPIIKHIVNTILCVSLSRCIYHAFAQLLFFCHKAALFYVMLSHNWKHCLQTYSDLSGREGGIEAREGLREGGKEGGREVGGSEAGREGGRERGREGGKEGEISIKSSPSNSLSKYCTFAIQK
jgi:hypothetical protein